MVISELISYKSKLSNGIKTWNLNFAFFVVFIFFWSLLKSFTNAAFWIMKRPADAMEPTLPTRHVLLKSECEVFVGKRFWPLSNGKAFLTAINGYLPLDRFVALIGYRDLLIASLLWSSSLNGSWRMASWNGKIITSTARLACAWSY